MPKNNQGPEAGRDFFETVRESSSQIWLAGLGAFAKAQQEGGKTFDKLAKEGEAQQQKMREFAETQLHGLQGLGQDLSNRVSEAGHKAANAWDRLEGVFEQRVGRAVSHLGVPTQADLEALRQQLAALTAEVAALRKESALKPKTEPGAVPGSAETVRKRSSKTTP